MPSKSKLKTIAGAGFSVAFLAGSFLVVCFGASQRDPAWVWALIYFASIAFPVALFVGVVALVASFFGRD